MLHWECVGKMVITRKHGGFMVETMVITFAKNWDFTGNMVDA